MPLDNFLILGDGGWGTSLAIILNKKGYKITLWSFFPAYSKYLSKKRINTKFLPGIKIPRSINLIHSFKDIRNRHIDIVILAVPSQHMRSVLKNFKKHAFPKEAIYLSVTKGIETNTLKRMSEVIHEELGNVKFAVLSGPTIAQEVAKNIPTTAVIASHDKKIREKLQDIFMTNSFRIYTNEDVVGVELGGSLKNVIAIACGISDGLGFGTNTKAAILSRGLSEISKLGHSMGANIKTFSGITGLGDLVTTCISPYSRNRSVGEEIGKGKTLRKINRGMQMVAEGVPTTKSAYDLSIKYKVDMPITREIYLVLYKKKSPIKAVSDLMARRKKEE